MDSESSRYDKLESMVQDGRSEPHNLPLEYLRNITNNFSDKRLLGEGGFGKVYKGVLQNGETIAVKKFNSSIPGVKDRQFENEAYHLMRLRHPNVVLLVACCSETEDTYVEYNGKYIWAEKSERLLCLEYMPKGSLRGYLSDEFSGLSWDTRYKIIEGICNGLHYLHEERQLNAPIVHMDLKPGNILLDNNMVPKIADFGLSRLFGEEKTWTCTASRDGTLGYMAPEYINRGLITTKSDIFSLGVIIIEIVTGHRDYPDETGISSEEFIKRIIRNWRNSLDKPQYYASFEIDCRNIRKCIQIGLLCVQFDRSKRPTTSQIIKMLHEMEGAASSNRKEAQVLVQNQMQQQQTPSMTQIQESSTSQLQLLPQQQLQLLLQQQQNQQQLNKIAAQVPNLAAQHISTDIDGNYRTPKDGQQEISLSMVSQSFGASDMAFNSIDSAMNDGEFLNRSWPPAPLKRMRTSTKVYKRGAVGQSIDISQYSGYNELKHALARMFSIDGQLEERQRIGWKLAYMDHEDAILFLGDEPWEEFVNCVRSIRILSPQDFQQMYEQLPELAVEEEPEPNREREDAFQEMYEQLPELAVEPKPEPEPEPEPNREHKDAHVAVPAEWNQSVAQLLCFPAHRHNSASDTAFTHFETEEVEEAMRELEAQRSATTSEGVRRVPTAEPYPPKEVAEEAGDEVDALADTFINRFRQQLKLQRIESFVRYRETIRRGQGAAGGV